MTPPSPTYDLDRLLRGNWHVHTTVSGCARREMTLPAIVRAAEAAGLATIALTDHDHAMVGCLPETLAALRDQRDRLHTNVRVLVGVELSAGTREPFVDADEAAALAEFCHVAANHYHLEPWRHPEDRSPAGYAAHLLETLRGVIRSGHAVAVAHPLSPRYISEDRAVQHAIARAISDEQLTEIMALAARHGVAWELYAFQLDEDPAFLARQWRIGRTVGVTFVFGTDAHSLDRIDTAPYRQRLRQVLENGL